VNQEGNVVTVRIAGEDYTIRAAASPDYTRECAAYVDRMLSEYQRGGSLTTQQKAPILVSLALTNELFQARQELDVLRAELARRTSALTAEIEQRLAASGLAAGS
jgi:cell division protein ZapA (FtsZ GTPase activity inhibitor)